MVLEIDFSESNYHHLVRQQGSIPFQWEEKPGLPKKVCKAEAVATNPIPSQKLVASVPFKWEEKPGKPLVHPQLQPCSHLLPLPPARHIGFPSPSAYSPSSPNPISRKFTSIRNFVWKVNSKVSPGLSTILSHYSSSVVTEEEEEVDDNDDDDDEMFEFDLEGFTFNTYESSDLKLSCSAPSLLANCLMPKEEMLNAVPVDHSPVNESWTFQRSLTENNSSAQSSESDCNSNSAGARLESHFPLLSPYSSFLDKVCCQETSYPLALTKFSGNENRSESNRFAVVRRTPTLGELIALSRKMSFINHAIHVKKQQSLSLEFMKRAFACCMFDGKQWIS